MRVLLSAGLCAAALVAGCGGRSETATTATGPAADAYTARVTAVCDDYKRRVTRTAQHFEATEHRAGAAGQLQAVAERYRATAGLLDHVVAKVRAVPAPAAAQDAVDGWLAARAREADDQRALADALDAGASGDAIDLIQERLAADEADVRAGGPAYGLGVCGPFLALRPTR